jgi:hypothetical protein
MRKLTARVFLIFLLLTIIITSFSHQVYSGDLTNSYLRLSSQKISTTTDGTVCAKTPSSDNGTETSVQIIFPTSFTVNTTASNWTVDTSNLPTGATAWSGIGTANAVSGQTVTFPSSNLSLNTFYCFNFSGTSTLTTPSSTGNFSGTIKTRNSSNATIDSIDYAVAIVTSNELSVSATVAANPTDFTAATTLSNTGSTFPQSTTLTYTITYGSSLTYPSAITVEAQWSLGTISGSSSPSVDMLDYVVGSATNGYNSTSAVIDTVNRKIDWTISSFPGSTTGQTVTFQLKTNSSYTGSSTVSFDVSGRLLGPGTQTADSTVTKNYQYNYGVAATPTPTSAPGPTNTPTPGPSTTSTPTPTGTITPTPILAKTLSFSDVSVRTISSLNATIDVLVNSPAGISVSYGTTPNNLISKISDPIFSSFHNMTFPALSPSTTYYFKVTAIDQNGKTLTSDIFTFKTAESSIAPEIDFQTLVLTSNNNVLLNSALNPSSTSQSSSGQTQTKQTVVVLPVSAPYQFTFSLQGHQTVKRIRAILRSKKILGLKNDVYAAFFPSEQTEAAGNVEIQEVQPGVYVGRFTGQLTPGTYELYIQIFDYSGNIVEQKIAEIRISKPFTIFSDLTKQPIEGAKVLLYLYNTSTKIYTLVSPSNLNVENPSFSKVDGTVNYVLYSGKYKAEIRAIGYKDKTVEFSISSYETDDYPQIYLTYTGLNFFNQMEYYIAAAADIYHAIQRYFMYISTSIRLFDFASVIIIFIFIILLITSSLHRFSISLFTLPWFILYHIKLFTKNTKHEHLLQGKIVDENGEPVKNALVYIALQNGKILSHTATNGFGEFFSQISNVLTVKVTVSHKNYKNFTDNFETQKGEKRIEIGLVKLEKPRLFSFGTIKWYIRFVLSSLFETLIIVNIILELILMTHFGFIKVLPFIMISFLNIILWASFARHSRKLLKG